MEMWRIMVRQIHCDDDSVEMANLWHIVTLFITLAKLQKNDETFLIIREIIQKKQNLNHFLHILIEFLSEMFRPFQYI